MLSGPGEVHPQLTPFTHRLEWTLTRQHSLLATWDLGIMPLRDGIYERGKCAYKLLQYGAAALPSLGSPVGASAEVLNAYGADAPVTTVEWIDALLMALDRAPEMRQAIGERSAEVVEAHYSYDAWQPTWRASVFER